MFNYLKSKSRLRNMFTNYIGHPFLKVYIKIDNCCDLSLFNMIDKPCVDFVVTFIKSFPLQREIILACIPLSLLNKYKTAPEVNEIFVELRE